jgi:hypothetical protein
LRYSEDVRPVDELVTCEAQLVRSVAEERRNTVAMLKLIAQSEADVKAGRTVSQEEAFARAERAIAQTEQTD